MPDWKKIVREKLGRLPLNDGRREEVIEELAQQLESAYEEALAQGVDEQEALRRSLAQFKDWEKLRSEVFQSLEGTRLPVWEQSGIFAPRRWPVWIALALTLVLLLVPAFRQSLAMFPFPGTNPTAWNSRVFSEKALHRIEQSGDKQKYARTLAFVALHSPEEDDLRAMHAAEKAIALDPQLTWISARVSHATYLMPGYDPHPWIERLKAWDPENAFPYLLEASANVHSEWETRWAKYNSATPELRRALAAEPRWRIPMEKAFAAPRMDLYSAQQFALDRQVLQEQGLDRPDMLLSAAWYGALPDFLAINLYEDIQLKEVGEPAEKAGRTEEALSAYWSVAHFGERLEATPAEFVQLYSRMLREAAYKRILPLLRREGRGSEAAEVETALAALPSRDIRGKRPFFSVEDSAARSARVVLISALFVALLGIVTALWLISMIVLKWRANLSRALNRLASALCFGPPLLLLGCAALFLGYYPYASSIGQFSSAEELANGYGPFYFSLYKVAQFDLVTDVWLAHMFWPSIWCAAFALAGALLLWWASRRERADRTGAA